MSFPLTFRCSGSLEFWPLILQKNNVTGEFPGGPVMKNLSSNAEDAGSISGQGNEIPHAAGQLSPHATNYRAHSPWSPRATTRERKPSRHSWREDRAPQRKISHAAIKPKKPHKQTE